LPPSDIYESGFLCLETPSGYRLWPCYARLPHCLPSADQGQLRETPFVSSTKFFRRPIAYRTAGGEPGHEYWQQQVDYDIAVRLFEDERRIEASERIRYTNTARIHSASCGCSWTRTNSAVIPLPKAVHLLPISSRRGPKWKRPVGRQTATPEPWKSCAATNSWPTTSWATNSSVRDARGDLAHAVVGTNLRIDLRTPLKPGESVEFRDRLRFQHCRGRRRLGARRLRALPGRRAPGRQRYLPAGAQWFPRLHAYTRLRGLDTTRSS
jgi:hypothetical protein